MSEKNEFCLVNIDELSEKINATDTNLMIIQDNDDTKKITLQNFIKSIIKDNELPGETRLYSSKKIYEMIQEFINSTTLTVTGMEGTIKDLQDNSATKKELEEAISDIDNKKIEPKDLEPINQVLSNKRDKNTLIKSEDLDTSDDDYKIKLRNLSEEVLNAMAGDTPLEIPQVPYGGWLSRHIANKAIISTKLGDYYRYRGFITEDSVNTIKDDGIYLLGPDVKGLPKYIPSDKNLCLMEVTRFGEAGKYIKQEIEYYDNTDIRPRYVRKGIADRIQSVKFHEEWDITTNFKVDSHLLDESFDNRGIIEDGNIFDIEDSGSYYIMSGVTGTPDISKPYTLEVSRHGNTIIYRLFDTTNDYCLLYVAEKFLTLNGISTVKGWHKINKLNKSRFDGDKVLIFGDGISYGIGASKLSFTSYPALLKSEYGFVVQNNSLGDATVGNYDDIQCTNKSVLTQIGRCSINDKCKYAIIFAGTNDWKLAKGPIGDINDYNDTTFYGALNRSVSLLLQYAPGIKILLVTPLFRARQDYGDNKNSDDYPSNYVYLREYAEAIINIGKKYHMPVLNLYDNSCVNKYNYTYYLENGLYPNDSGHKLIATQIYNYMNMYF